jgi:cell shape-determining protein MreC
MEVALGLRQKQQSEFDGTLDEAKVLSIDTESGLIVINAGRKGGVEVGMPMEISRGDQVIAETMVTDVRKSVSGLLVQRHLNPVLSIGVGDRVSVKTND